MLAHLLFCSFLSSQELLIRLTDEGDPFFLFTLAMAEEDFQGWVHTMVVRFPVPGPNRDWNGASNLFLSVCLLAAAWHPLSCPRSVTVSHES